MTDTTRTLPCECPRCKATVQAHHARAHGWTLISGGWFCPDCEDYSVGPDGAVLCGTHDVPDDIEWGPVHTPPGRRAYQLGRDARGRKWITHERGGWTVPRPVDDDE